MSNKSPENLESGDVISYRFGTSSTNLAVVINNNNGSVALRDIGGIWGLVSSHRTKSHAELERDNHFAYLGVLASSWRRMLSLNGLLFPVYRVPDEGGGGEGG